MWIMDGRKIVAEAAKKAFDQYDKGKYQKVVFDIETTGLDSHFDEIIQFSAINDKGEVLLNTYIKPYEIEEWPEAERINGITPDMVKDCKYLDHYAAKIQEILLSATELITYNGIFDMEFLREDGICVPYRTPEYDVMRKFAPIYGEYNSYYGEYKWQKLTTCADYYGYKFAAHDSLEDCRATLYCYQQITKDKR